MVSLGRPLGSEVRPLLLQRTTVSRQEHSAGHLSTGEQLFSSLPDGQGQIDGVVQRRGEDDKKVEIKKKKLPGLQNLQSLELEKSKLAPSHRLHRQSPGQLHPEWGSPSRNKDSGSEGYQ